MEAEKAKHKIWKVLKMCKQNNTDSLISQAIVITHKNHSFNLGSVTENPNMDRYAVIYKWAEELSQNNS